MFDKATEAARKWVHNNLPRKTQDEYDELLLINRRLFLRAVYAERAAFEAQERVHQMAEEMADAVPTPDCHLEWCRDILRQEDVIRLDFHLRWNYRRSDLAAAKGYLMHEEVRQLVELEVARNVTKELRASVERASV